MSDTPFKFIPTASGKYKTAWEDAGTGGTDWSILISDNTFYSDVARVSDMPYYDNPSVKDSTFNSLDTKKIVTPNTLLVTTRVTPDKPTVPATSYKLLGELNKGSFKSRVYLPAHEDSNYIALGHVVRKVPEVPLPGEYYLVHKKHLNYIGTNAPLLFQEDGMNIYNTIEGTNVFRIDDPTRYTLRTTSQLIGCCSGNVTNCEDWVKGSIPCQQEFVKACSGKDLQVPDSVCANWCERDPIACDQVKINYCLELNPNDPFCDCINAISRPDHAALVKGNEVVYNASIPACYYPKCKTGPTVVFTTADQRTAQTSGGRCAVDLKYIDQKVSVVGANNVVKPTQTVTEYNNTGGTTVSGGTPVTTEETDNRLKWIIFSIVAFIVFILGIGAIFYTEDNADDADDNEGDQKNKDATLNPDDADKKPNDV